jgi:hypothetical protein
MKKFLFFCIWICVVCVKAAVPTFESFSDQFQTNNLRVFYRAVWTNDAGIVYEAGPNSLTLVTNENVYGTFSLPAKVTLLTLGTNQLDMATASTWLLNSPTNDPTQVILSLSAGAYQGQLAFITSQNGGNSFTLPDLSEQWDVPGAYVDIQGDWMGTTNRGIILQYTAPDWIEMARFDPSSTNTVGGTTINPTDTFIPVRVNSTTFLDSPFWVTSGAANTIKGISVGTNTSIAYGPVNQEALVAVRVSGVNGDTGNPEIYISRSTTTNLSGDHSYLDLNPTSGSSLFTVGTKFGGTNNSVGMYSAAEKSIVTFQRGSNNSFDAADVGSPEGVLAARPGSTYRNLSGGAGTSFYVKESGNLTTTGWIAYGAGSGSALWASAGGVLTPSPDVDEISLTSVSGTNYWFVRPDAPDGQEIYFITSLSPHVVDGPLYEWYNGTNAAFIVDQWGAMYLGPNTENLWGIYSGNSIIQYLDPSLGDPSAYDWASYVKGAAGNSYWEVFGTTNHASQGMISILSTGVLVAWRIENGDVGATLSYEDASIGTITTFNPTAAASVTPNILGTTLTHSSGNLLAVQNNLTNKMWLEFDGTLHAKDFVPTSSAFRTEDTSGASFVISAHDDDIAGEAGRKTFATLQNGSIPSLLIAPPSGGTVTIDATTYKAGGTSGLTQTNILAIVGVLTNTSIYKAGLLISSVTVPP